MRIFFEVVSRRRLSQSDNTSITRVTASVGTPLIRRLQVHHAVIRPGTEALSWKRPAKAWTFIWAEDAGRFAAWLGLNEKAGAYNAGSHYAIDAVEIVEEILK